MQRHRGLVIQGARWVIGSHAIWKSELRRRDIDWYVSLTPSWSLKRWGALLEVGTDRGRVLTGTQVSCLLVHDFSFVSLIIQNMSRMLPPSGNLPHPSIAQKIEHCCNIKVSSELLLLSHVITVYFPFLLGSRDRDSLLSLHPHVSQCQGIVDA